MVTKVVLREHLDTSKGFKFNEDAQKIEIAVKSGELEFTPTGELKIAASILSNAGRGVNTMQLQQGGGTSKIVTTLMDGSNVEIDVSALAKDIHVSGASFDAETLTLTLTQESGDPVTVNLGELTKTTTSNTQSITLTGDGTKLNPLKGDVNISVEPGNKLSIKSDGLYATGVTATELAGTGLKVDAGKLAIDNANVFTVELQDAFGTKIGYISATNA